MSHGRGNLRGEFLKTLTAMDIHTSWLQLAALRNKAQKWVYEAIEEMRKRLPFELLGIDSDNGAEFINAHLMRYSKEYKITFTRSRKYRKDEV
ncbi:MAG: transposase family protein [Coprothermobacterota bacterium]|nr:transposase family protein [Coprothermobacterota bacterium]